MSIYTLKLTHKLYILKRHHAKHTHVRSVAIFRSGRQDIVLPLPSCHMLIRVIFKVIHFFLISFTCVKENSAISTQIMKR